MKQATARITIDEMTRPHGHVVWYRGEQYAVLSVESDGYAIGLYSTDGDTPATYAVVNNAVEALALWDLGWSALELALGVIETGTHCWECGEILAGSRCWPCYIGRQS